MEQKDENLRERLLARLPQPENVETYREQTASLLAQHERALFWDRWTARAITWVGGALWIVANSSWGLHPRLNANETILFDSFSGLLVIAGGMYGLSYYISRSKVDLLKEIKQVQLQVLELQASLSKQDRM